MNSSSLLFIAATLIFISMISVSPVRADTRVGEVNFARIIEEAPNVNRDQLLQQLQGFAKHAGIDLITVSAIYANPPTDVTDNALTFIRNLHGASATSGGRGSVGPSLVIGTLNPSIRWINYQKVLEGAPETKAAMVKLAAEFSGRQAEINRMPSQGKATQEIQISAAEFQKDVNARRTEELGKINRHLVQQVSEFAKASGVDLLFSSDTVFGRPSLDMTTGVLAYIRDPSAAIAGSSGGTSSVPLNIGVFDYAAILRAKTQGSFAQPTDNVTSARQYLDPKIAEYETAHNFDLVLGANVVYATAQLMIDTGLMAYLSGLTDTQLDLSNVRSVDDSSGHYEGHVLNHARNGRGMQVYPNGNRYEGEFKDNFANGHGVLSLPSGDRIEGDFEKGGLKGGAILTRADGSRYAGAGTFGANGAITFNTTKQLHPSTAQAGTSLGATAAASDAFQSKINDLEDEVEANEEAAQNLDQEAQIAQGPAAMMARSVATQKRQEVQRLILQITELQNQIQTAERQVSLVPATAAGGSTGAIIAGGPPAPGAGPSASVGSSASSCWSSELDQITDPVARSRMGNNVVQQTIQIAQTGGTAALDQQIALMQQTQVQAQNGLRAVNQDIAEIAQSPTPEISPRICATMRQSGEPSAIMAAMCQRLTMQNSLHLANGLIELMQCVRAATR